MPNPYYNAGSYPATGAPASSSSMRAELALIAAGFDKLPTLSGAGNQFVVVNSTGTALTTTATLPAASVNDNAFTFQDNADNTRKFQFEASGITAGATRTFTVPDANTTLVGTDATQTLTNKTVNLTSNTLSGTVAQFNTALSDGDFATIAGTETLTNKTLTTPVLSGTASGTTAGRLGYSAGVFSYGNGTVQRTVVNTDEAQTLTNKTISGASNTLSNIANASLTNSSVTIGSTAVSLGGTATTIAGLTSVTSTTFVGALTGNASTVTNGVYTTGDQNIAGSKRFSGSVVVGGTGTAAVNLDVQTTGANVLTSAFTTGITDLNFRAGFMNGVSGGTAGTSQAKVGLFYLGTGEAATIDFRRGSTSTDGSIAFRTSGTDRATLDNSGNFAATGNVTASGGTMTIGSSALAPSGSAPSYTARAWVNFNGTGTVAVRASGNVSSISDNGVGDYTVNLTTAISTSDSVVVVDASGEPLTNSPPAFCTCIARSTTTARVATTYSTDFSSQSAYDDSIVDVAIFR